MAKRTLTVRGIPDPILRGLRSRAAANRRSLNSELLLILEGAVLGPSPTVHEATTRPYSPAPPGSAEPVFAGIDRRALARVCRRYRIERLAVFGSVARGDAGPASDVDVAVDFEPGMTPGLEIVAVADALQSVFGGRRVDLVTRRGLNPRLRERMLADMVLLHGS